MFSNPIFIRFRNLLRKIGILKILKTFISTNTEYEYRFHNEMIKSLKKDMTVFDIGANIGLYTKIFAEKVKEKGHVFAFEPSHESALKINDLRTTYPWITIIESVIGDEDKDVMFEINEKNPTSVVNKVASNPNNNNVKKEMITIDSICKKYKIPNLIKIDVEGFELNVLNGAKNTLKNSTLKHVFIEIHFSILEEMGETFGPKKIQTLLKSNGFKIKYLDFSHIHAYRS